MKKLIGRLQALIHGKADSGMATAEYAVGTIAIASVGGIFWKLFQSEWFQSLLHSFIQWLFDWILHLFV